MKHFKHFALTVLMALVCCLSASAYDFEVDGIYYDITSSTDLTCEVTASSNWSNHNTYSGDIVIPSSVTYDGITYSVTSLGFSFNYCSNLTSVFIPESVTSFVWSNPFWLCTGLKNIFVDSNNPNYKSVDGVLYNKAMTELIKFPSCSYITDYSISSSVTKINDDAFTYCENLESVTIPSGVTEIKQRMFSNCKALSDININSRNSNYSSVDGVVFNKDKSSLLIYPSGRSSEVYKIPIGVKVIGNSAFDNSKLKSVVIPNGVTKIESNAFNSCKRLKSVEIPNSLTEIEAMAFMGCSSLTSISIPENVTNIGTWAFMSCSNLQSVYYNAESCKMMGDDRHDASNYGAFHSCDALKEFHIGSNVKYIPYGAFGYNINLDGVYIEDMSAWLKVKFENSEANPLYKAKDLYLNNQVVKDLVIPTTTTKINDYAFYGCSGLASVSIPRGIVSIGKQAFENCNNITNVNIEDIESWCNIDFADSRSNPCCYSKGLTLNGSQISELIIPNSISTIKKYTFYCCNSITSVNFSNCVKEILDYAFEGCTGLTTFVLPKNLETIGQYAIPSCITSIYLPRSLKSIHPYALEYSTNLSSVYIEDLASYCSIDFSSVNYSNNNPLFTNSSTKLYIDDEFVTDLVIPEGVKEVKPYAFYNCQALLSVTIPSSMEKMGDNCFLNNTMQKVYISDLEAWCKIDFDGPQANPLFNRRSLYINGVLTSEIVFPETLTEVKAGAFACSTITKVQLHENVNKIGNQAFMLSTLADINIPESVVEIGTMALFRTPWYTNNVKYGSDGLCYINNVLFSCKSGTTTANIKSGTVSIAGDAFNSGYMQNNKNTSLTTVIMPSTLKHIGANAFRDCTRLSTINIPEGVEEIDFSAFSGCEALQNIIIPQTLKKVGNNAFYCSNNKIERNIYINDLVAWCNIDFEGYYYANPMQHYSSSSYPYSSGGSNLYLNNKLVEELVIPEVVSEIKSCTFVNCGSLTSVIFHDNLKSIGKMAFYQCQNLTADLIIPKGIKRIEEATFCNNKIKNITLPKSIEYIGEDAFYGDEELKSITLPYKLKTIKSNAFYGCKNLATIHNASSLQLEKGSWDNGYVAYYATEIINIAPEIYIYNGNSNVIYAGNLEEAEMAATAANALVFAEIDEDNLPANYIVDNESQSIVLTDAEPFYCPSDFTTKSLKYSRDFKNTNWQALYIPFAMKYEDWKDYADVAYINNVHQWDDNGDGVIDRTALEFITKKSGSIEANKPYVIKPKKTGEVTFKSEYTTLYAAPEEDGYVDCRSTTTEYTIRGTYQPKTDMYEGGYYAMSGGGFMLANNAGVTLSPFRIYLEITERTGAGALKKAPQRISIVVDGVEDEACSVEGLVGDAFGGTEGHDGFNLGGQKVGRGYKGIVVRNGRKFLVK